MIHSQGPDAPFDAQDPWIDKIVDQYFLYVCQTSQTFPPYQYIYIAKIVLEYWNYDWCRQHLEQVVDCLANELNKMGYSVTMLDRCHLESMFSVSFFPSSFSKNVFCLLKVRSKSVLAVCENVVRQGESPESPHVMARKMDREDEHFEKWLTKVESILKEGTKKWMEQENKYESVDIDPLCSLDEEKDEEDTGCDLRDVSNLLTVLHRTDFFCWSSS